MKKIIALLLIALVILVSGCIASDTTGEAGNQTVNPLTEDFGNSGSDNVGSPPEMPELPSPSG